MTGMGVRWAPIAPERPREQSDRAWIADYQRRHQAARARRYNRVVAAEVENPNTQLNRALQEMSLRAERRRMGHARVNRLLADAALDGHVARYQRLRDETEALISRLARRADPYAGYAGRGTPEEAREIARMVAERRQRGREAARGAGGPAVPGPGYCRGCGALADWCVCVQR